MEAVERPSVSAKWCLSLLGIGHDEVDLETACLNEYQGLRDPSRVLEWLEQKEAALVGADDTRGSWRDLDSK